MLNLKIKMLFMNMAKGTLIPIGGNEDKGLGINEKYTLEFIEEGILYHVVKEAGGTDANIVVIPTASSIPVEVGENYTEAFTTLGCKNVTVLNIKSKKDSEKPEAIAAIKNAGVTRCSLLMRSSVLDNAISINLFAGEPSLSFKNRTRAGKKYSNN